MNVELADKALAAAKLNRDSFDMNRWISPVFSEGELGDGDDEYESYLTRWDAPHLVDDQHRVPPCGTTGCFAGFVAFQAAPAGTIIANGGDLYRSMEDLKKRAAFGHVENYATEQLDITSAQADALFCLDTLEQVERAVRHLADNPDATGDSIREAAGMPDEDE